MLPNIPEFIISYFSALKIGAVAVTINTASTSYELGYLLANSDSKILITVPSSSNIFEEIKEDLPLCTHLILTGEDDGDDSICDFVGEGSCEIETPTIDGDDPAVMIYTSGLTGRPLGAVLTHFNLLTQSPLVRTICDGREDDRNLCVIPLFHSFGAMANMTSAFEMGACVVMMDKFSVDNMFRLIEKERVTYIAAVPRLFLGMFMSKNVEHDLSSLRLCITGGSTMPPEFIEPFIEKFDVKLMEGYGLTEASPVCSFGRLDMEQKLGSVGIPIPGTKAKVFDEEGRELPANETGELAFKGPNVMKGYYGNEAATSKVIKDGWLHTGDLARIDEDGYIFLAGRKKRMIITNGFNVYPKEIENVLDSNPSVEESRVVGKPNFLRGEVGKALVVKKENATVDEREIIRYCRLYLSSHKVPREVKFVESFDKIPEN
jgi:long-chain acyl-CoA synthetase